MTPRLEEIRARLEELKPEILDLSAKDEATEDEVTALEERMTEFEALTEEATPLEERAGRIENVRNASLTPANRTEGDGTRRAPIPGINRTPDVFDVSAVRSLTGLARMGDDDAADELRSRAMDAVELVDCSNEALNDEARDNVTRLLERSEGRTGVAQHVLATGSPEYLSAFRKVLRYPSTFAATLNPEESDSMRTALSLTNANGGFLVPFLLDPTIILTNNGATNPLRGIADVRTVDVNVWHGVASGGVNAEWIAEATEVADASPTFVQPTITCAKADAYIQASWEVIADSGISSELSMLIADAKDRLEATAFVVGTGSGQPKGVSTAVSGGSYTVAGSSGAAGAADFVVADVYAVQNALPPRYRPNASWLAEQTTYNKIRQFATGSGPQHAFWADLGMNIPAQLLGRPTYEASNMDNTIVSGSTDDVLLLGDFKAGYKIIDRIGVSVLFEPIVLGSNRRPTGESGWVAYWRVGGDATNSAAFRLLRL